MCIRDRLKAIENSDLKTAAAIQRKFIPKVNALFSVPSPAPVKAVLNHLGFEVGPVSYTHLDVYKRQDLLS